MTQKTMNSDKEAKIRKAILGLLDSLNDTFPEIIKEWVKTNKIKGKLKIE